MVVSPAAAVKKLKVTLSRGGQQSRSRAGRIAVGKRKRRLQIPWGCLSTTHASRSPGLMERDRLHDDLHDTRW